MAIPPGYVFPDLNGYVRHNNAVAFAKAYPVSACKVSEGANFGSAGSPGTSDYWPSYLAMCRAAHLYPIGYHFLRRGVAIGAQVDNFLRRAGAGSYGVMLDIETAGNGTNPTMAEADAWFDVLSQRTGRPRSAMASYVGRGWYDAHGGGSTALRDTVWWLPHYSRNPDLSPMAGWARPSILQFSSTAPGAGMPPGDMNVAINMTASQLRAMLTASKPTGGTVPFDTSQTKYLAEQFDDIRDRVWDVRYQREGDVGHDVNLENTNARLSSLEAKVDQILGLLKEEAL